MGGKSQLGTRNHLPVVASSWTPHVLNCCLGSCPQPPASPAPDLTVFHWVSQVSVCQYPPTGCGLIPLALFHPSRRGNYLLYFQKPHILPSNLLSAYFICELLEPDKYIWGNKNLELIRPAFESHLCHLLIESLRASHLSEPQLPHPWNLEMEVKMR